MRKIFTIITLDVFLCLNQMFAITIISPELEQKLDGSLLCNNLSRTWHVPDSLKGNYTYTSTVSLSDTSNDFYINYYLTLEGDKALEQITTDLSEAHEKRSTIVLDENNTGLFTIHETVHIGKRMALTSAFEDEAYKVCYQINEDCSDFHILKKSMQSAPICYEEYLKNVSYSNAYVLNDSIVFPDNYGRVYPANCLIVSVTKLVVDTFRLKTKLVPASYKVVLDKPYNCKTICTEDVPISYCSISCTSHNYTFVGTANLSACLIKGIESSSALQNKAYPNPATDFINIKEFKGDISLINHLGHEFKISGDEQFSLSNIESGIYLVVYEKDGLSVREKIIIE